MKKIIAIILVMILSFGLCACTGGDSGNDKPPVTPGNPPVTPQNPSGGNKPDNPNQGNNPPSFDRKDAIQVKSDLTPRFLTEGTDETVQLTHINVQTFPQDAQSLLDLAYEALASVFFKANVSDMFYVPLGLAAQYASFDPVLIVTDNEKLNEDPLFMVPMYDPDGYTLIATFFGSDVEENHYRDKCVEDYTFYINTLLSKNGLLGADIQVFFNGEKLKNLEFKPVSDEFIKLYENANDRILTFATGDVISDDGWQTADADGRCKVDLYNLKSIADLQNWLGEFFTEDIVNAALTGTDSYVEKDGALWAYPAGIGDNMSIDSIRPKFMAQKNDTTVAMIVELTRVEFDESWDQITGRHFEEYYFELIRTSEGWKFSVFSDLAFGFI